MKRQTRTVLADMMAMGLFLSTGVITFWYDTKLIGLAGSHWFFIHFTCGILKIACARWCGEVTDWIRWQILGGNTPKTFRRCIADGLSLGLIQVVTYIVIYAVVGIFFGIDKKQLGIAVGVYFLDGLLLGGLYGSILNFVRRILGVVPTMESNSPTPIPHAVYLSK